MESNDDKNLKAINESVGRLVWVRRRNGSWWPGQTLLHDEVPEKSLVSPKVGTPIKLLGRDDVNVDWYVLEKSKMVKAFRCGEYDACIEKAKAAAVVASSSNKKGDKCSRREDAINDALKIENAHLAKEDDAGDDLCGSSGKEDSERCVSGKDDEDTESDDAGEAEDKLDLAPEQLQSSMSFQEMNNGGDCKMQTRRRRTPNDSEDDGTEGIKRMRGLEDIVELGDSVSNGNVHANGNKVCSPLSLKRKKSQGMNGNECSKRRNRRRQLTKVLENTAMVSVPVTCDQLVIPDSQGIYDSKLLGMESVESMKSVSVVINNNSDSTGVSCENASENVARASHNNKTKDSEISSISVSAQDGSEKLFDVPVIGDDKHSAGFPAACTFSSSKTALISGLTRRRGRSSHDVVKKEGSNGSACTSPPATQSSHDVFVKKEGINGAACTSPPASQSNHDVFVKKEVINGTACTSPPATQPVNCHLNGIEKSASKWQLKGKRNSRQMSKKQEERRNVYGEEANNNSPLRLSAFYDVKIQVEANYNKRHNVPLVSRMSQSSGKPIVGHPITVGILEEGYCDGMVMPQVAVKAKTFSKKNGKKRRSHAPWSSKKKKPTPLLQKTRRLSTITSQKLTDKSKKQITTKKAKDTVVACIPLKVVFSRINQVLKGSTRHMLQQRPLPSAAAT